MAFDATREFSSVKKAVNYVFRQDDPEQAMSAIYFARLDDDDSFLTEVGNQFVERFLKEFGRLPAEPQKPSI